MESLGCLHAIFFLTYFVGTENGPIGFATDFVLSSSSSFSKIKHDNTLL